MPGLCFLFLFGYFHGEVEHALAISVGLVHFSEYTYHNFYISIFYSTALCALYGRTVSGLRITADKADLATVFPKHACFMS